MSTKQKDPPAWPMRVLSVAEVLCCLVVALGVGLLFGLGAGLVVGGVLGVLACERAAVQLERQKPKRGERT